MGSLPGGPPLAQQRGPQDSGRHSGGFRCRRSDTSSSRASSWWSKDKAPKASSCGKSRAHHVSLWPPRALTRRDTDAPRKVLSSLQPPPPAPLCLRELPAALLESVCLTLCVICPCSPKTDTSATTPAATTTMEEAIEQARRAFALRKYEQSVDHYATALELAYVPHYLGRV